MGWLSRGFDHSKMIADNAIGTDPFKIQTVAVHFKYRSAAMGRIREVHGVVWKGCLLAAQFTG